MSTPFPAYYHSLGPFKTVFAAGVPILTYHKLGPRPGGVRLKGLYLSQNLFSRQLAELRGAGFTTASLAQLQPSDRNAERRFVLTFDDGFVNVLRHGLEPLARTGFRAIQFLVVDLIGKSNEWEQREGEAPEPLMDDAQVRDWLAAGHALGSHTCTHPPLTRIPVERAREEITASKKHLEDRFGTAVDDFCYPYGDWNETIRDVAAAAGYRTACTTEPGVNGADACRWLLKRFTARYPSRNFKALWQRWRWRGTQGRASRAEDRSGA